MVVSKVHGLMSPPPNTWVLHKIVGASLIRASIDKNVVLGLLRHHDNSKRSTLILASNLPLAGKALAKGDGMG